MGGAAQSAVPPTDSYGKQREIWIAQLAIVVCDRPVLSGKPDRRFSARHSRAISRQMDSSAGSEITVNKDKYGADLVHPEPDAL